MPRVEPESEAWRKMVLRSMQPPAWLGCDAPEGDVVISSRCRYARNLCGYRFPHHASTDELFAVQRAVSRAVARPELRMEAMKRLTEAERDFLLGSRLISPEFPHRKSGRMVLLDPSRTVSVMVNEEDHLRVQALTAGWSIRNAEAAADRLMSILGQELRFMRGEGLGYLTASPSNVGEARRWSALFHLIGLAHTRRLTGVLKAMAERGLTARGLFGESSRAVGAFFQVSATSGGLPEFVGACEYLIAQERQARQETSRFQLMDLAYTAADFAVGQNSISLADALRVLGWVRWAVASGQKGLGGDYRDVDHWISTMEVHGTQDERVAARHRATFLRERIEHR